MDTNFYINVHLSINPNITLVACTGLEPVTFGL